MVVQHSYLLFQNFFSKKMANAALNRRVLANFAVLGGD